MPTDIVRPFDRIEKFQDDKNLILKKKNRQSFEQSVGAPRRENKMELFL